MEGAPRARERPADTGRSCPSSRLSKDPAAGASAGPHSPGEGPEEAQGLAVPRVCEGRRRGSRPRDPGHILALRAPLALQPAGDVRGTRGSAALLPPQDR